MKRTQLQFKAALSLAAVLTTGLCSLAMAEDRKNPIEYKNTVLCPGHPSCPKLPPLEPATPIQGKATTPDGSQVCPPKCGPSGPFSTVAPNPQSTKSLGGIKVTISQNGRIITSGVTPESGILNSPTLNPGTYVVQVGNQPAQTINITPSLPKRVIQAKPRPVDPNKPNDVYASPLVLIML